MNEYQKAIKRIIDDGFVFPQTMIDDMSDQVWGNTYRTWGCEEHFCCHSPENLSWDYCKWDKTEFPTLEDFYYKYINRPQKMNDGSWKWIFGYENQGVAEWVAYYKDGNSEPIVQYEMDKIVYKTCKWSEFGDAIDVRHLRYSQK